MEIYLIEIDPQILCSSQVATVDERSDSFKDPSLCFDNLALNFGSSISMVNMRHNLVIFMDPSVHVHDDILYPKHYSHLQNRVEAIRRDHNPL